MRAVPLLIVWSVINRHYILDLAKDRSFIEYAVGQGLQVFVTSWRNPTAEHADWNLDTYAQALLDATDAIREITGSEQIGTVGLCAGGQLLAAVMAHLQAAGDDRIAHAGFGVSQIDMSVPNVAGLALHPALHGAARLGTEATGVVDGRAIAAVFSWLRPTELVWNQWVNNYLMGKDAPQYDILAWNNDTTRVSGALQRDLLRIAMDNLLATPDGLTLLGTPVDLGDDHRRHLRRGRRDRPPRPVAGRVPLDPAVRRRLHLRPLRRGPHPAPRQPARQPQGPLQHRTGRRSTRTPGSPARPSRPAAGGRTGPTGRSPAPARSGPLRRSSAAVATGPSRRPRGGT